MRYFCPGCGTKYTMPDEQIPDEGMDFSCPSCGFATRLKRPPVAVPTSPAAVARQKAESAGATIPDGAVAGEAAEPPATPAPAAEQQAPEADRVEESVSAAVSAESEPESQPAAPGQGSLPAADSSGPRSRLAGAGRGWLTAWLQVLGTGKGGAAFTFWDLLRCLGAALDPRKVVSAGVLVFAATLLAAGLGWLAGLAGNRVIAIIGAVLGLVLLWLASYLGLALAAVLAEREMRSGSPQPWRQAANTLSTGLWGFLAAPLRLVVAALVGAAVILLLALLGRIPVAGPLLYGLTFPASLLLGFAVVVCLLYLGVVQLACPALAAREPGGAACLGRLWRLVCSRPGRFFAYLLLTVVAAYLIMVLGSSLLASAWLLLGWLGSKGMGPALSDVYLAIPAGLFGALVLLLPDLMVQLFAAAGSVAWCDSVAGWLVGLTMLLALSLVAGALLAYLGSAGVVLVGLLEREAEPDR